MASQAEREIKVINEYRLSPVHDPAVLREMLRMHDYANTIDTDAASKAAELLSPRSVSANTELLRKLAQNQPKTSSRGEK